MNAEAELIALRSMCRAAAAEIQKHYDAHCDAEGYGPCNLMARLTGRLGPALYPHHATHEECVRFTAGMHVDERKATQDAGPGTKEDETATLPEWINRITFRRGADDEIILRVPREDGEGGWYAVNCVLTMRQAMKLGMELAEALVDQTVKQRERMDAEKDVGHG